MFACAAVPGVSTAGSDSEVREGDGERDDVREDERDERDVGDDDDGEPCPIYI